ncbi:unnamed protein product [Ectocarpus sp. 13 AM-2016]
MLSARDRIGKICIVGRYIFCASGATQACQDQHNHHRLQVGVLYFPYQDGSAPDVLSAAAVVLISTRSSILKEDIVFFDDRSIDVFGGHFVGISISVAPGEGWHACLLVLRERYIAETPDSVWSHERQCVYSRPQQNRW